MTTRRQNKTSEPPAFTENEDPKENAKKYKLPICIVFALLISLLIFYFQPETSPTIDIAGVGNQNLNPEFETNTYVIKTIQKNGEPDLKEVVELQFSEVTKKKLKIPIEVLALESADPLVKTCYLDFYSYSQSPWRFPMFKDLVSKSCSWGSSTNQQKMSVLLAESENLRKIPPTGFVFHESRCGSTLVANLLGSNPYHLVYSESSPPAMVVSCGRGVCSRKKQVENMKNIISLMGVTPYHQQLFFKFQSIVTASIDIVLDAFPDTPWIFVYREPVQVMMSHLKQGGYAGAPCLRAHSSPPPKTIEILKMSPSAAKKTSNEVFCAAHLAMLCSNAIQSAQKSDGKGIMLNYEQITSLFISKILPGHFNVHISAEYAKKMEETSGQYSKSRSSGNQWKEDSTKKMNMASNQVRSAAETYLESYYNLLTTMSKQALEPSLEIHLPQQLSPNKISSSQQLTRLATVENQDLMYNIESQHGVNSIPFDKISCPDFPAENYPTEYNILDIIQNWNPDNTDIPNKHFRSICRFDYQTEFNKARNYRNKERPFVIYNIPEVEEVVNRWKDIDYLKKKLGNKKYRVEVSENNHFMYWRNFGVKARGWKPPTSVEDWTFEKWLHYARQGENISVETPNSRYYFRVSDDTASWLQKELPFFKSKPGNLFIQDALGQRGIHCRFGMKGIIAEAHWDGSRNMIALLGGLRRYILTHPRECQHMYLLPPNHPSGRHSEVDWSKPDLKMYPKFARLQANEVILSPGDVLYLPTEWIHYIMSLGINWQCNTRSGRSDIFVNDLRKCGFNKF